MLSQLVQERLEDLDKLHELKHKQELIESEIRELMGDDFDTEAFFEAAGFSTQDEVYLDDLSEGPITPEYFAENIIIEEEDGTKYKPE